MFEGVDVASQVYLNGAFLRLDEAQVSVLDRGFIFGDGVYEVVPVYAGKPFRMDEHLARLGRSLAALRIASPLDDRQWRELVTTLAKDATCSVYIQVTRGVARRDHAFPKHPVEPTVFAMSTPFTPPGKGVRDEGLTAIGIVDERWLHCEIKSISLLGNVLAKQEAVEAGVDEAIQFRDGWLTEGASTNVWVVIDDTLLAPPRTNLILEGIRYGLMLSLAEEQGIPVVMRPISRAEVECADELMLTSASKEVLPVVRLDGQNVGGGQPGPVYARLRKAYDERIAAL